MPTRPDAIEAFLLRGSQQPNPLSRREDGLCFAVAALVCVAIAMPLFPVLLPSLFLLRRQQDMMMTATARATHVPHPSASTASARSRHSERSAAIGRPGRR